MKKLLLLTISAALIAGCASTVNTYEPANQQAAISPVKDKRVITDSSLSSKAFVSQINKAEVGGLLKVQAKIVNNTSDYCMINYKFTWIDKDGMEFDSTTSKWQNIVLEGREAKFVSAVAPSPNVVDFTLKLLSDVRE
ncbi:MAG: YcfL family protein [Opitutales bacterium]|nr:YcfL family protein [Opitutales bacterium]